ncbi:hypothetical protein M8C21_006430 [Ambrosia artemisiifolia]|uniref:Uncharacterized protein n=1 Tax=Ambrosia artemisiifolia TaxID=4212 RepID=A0AAD5GX37_AMBAR|nr:hypothetical protein M8C21_006430 [Ambrosia artemisiifolia]
MLTTVSFSSIVLPLVNDKIILNGAIHHHPCRSLSFCGQQFHGHKKERRRVVHADVRSQSGSESLHWRVSNTSNKEDSIRNTLKFHGSIWGDRFLTYEEKEDLAMEKEIVEELKEVVRKELMITYSSESRQQMQLIDEVQRLGVAYHFEDEIEDVLHHIYATYGNDMRVDNHDLQSDSLWFRLLRQQGFNVSSGTFKKYMDANGTFNNESLSNDAQGMLALYEASYMRVEGEQILEDALEFTKTHLPKIANDPYCDSLLRTQIKQALNQPLRKSVQRLQTVRYIPIYQQQPTHNEALLKLAKVDFNVLQSLHKKELSQICKWWKDLDVQTKLPYARDRIIEGYHGLLAVSFEPQHSCSRIFLTKACACILLLDDTYDNYATYEELEIFTKAIQRWSISSLDMLPEYMKLIYQELVNIHQEMEELLEKDGKAYQIHYVKKLMKEFTRSLLLEAKWTKEGYMPPLKEYMSNSLVTSTFPLIIGESCVGRGDNMITEDSFKWIASHPPLVLAASSIIRLMDDIVTHKKEQERNHVASSIECYQNETGASEEEACDYMLKQVEDAWKLINRESLRPTNIPVSLVNIIINLARLAHETYKHNDGITDAGEEAINYVKSLLVYPMII